MFSDTKYNIQKIDSARYISLGDSSHESELIFLHGMFGGLSNFEAVLDQIPPEKYHVIVPKLPLFECQQNKNIVEVLSEWLYNLMNQLSIEKATLIGNSMGGHIALDFSHKYPGKTDKLVLTGSSGLIENEMGTSKPRRFDRSYIREQASKTFYKNMVDDTMVDEISEVLQSPSKLRCIIKIARDTKQYNMASILPRITHKTLLIWGKQDRITPKYVAEKFHQLLPNSNLHIIDQCGHAPMMEQPGQFVEAMCNFINLDSNYVNQKQTIT